MTTTAPQLLPYLERLLDGETVEWKTLGEVGTFVRGTSFQKKDFEEKGIGCIHYGEIYTRYDLSTQKTFSFLNEEIANKARKAGYGDLIIATTSENDDDVCKSVVWLGTENVVVSNDACYYHHTLNPKYVAYFFRTDEFQKQKRAYITGTKVKRVNANDLARIILPIPPLRVQARIVEILDKFTQLEAELEAELEARNKQYDFYRNRLLDFAHRDDFDGKVEWKTLGEVFNTRNGYTPSKTNDNFWKDGTIPWFRMDDIRANGRILYDSALHITPKAVKRNGLFKANSIILATSATIGEHALLQQDALTNQRFTDFEIKEELQELLLPKFAFYYFFIIDEWCKKHTIIGNFPSVDTQQLMEQPFPLPPLSEQRRIVEILDRFDTLTNSISEGLPREIALRRKQYEYYRDALLRFPQPAPTT